MESNVLSGGVQKAAPWEFQCEDDWPGTKAEARIPQTTAEQLQLRVDPYSIAHGQDFTLLSSIGPITATQTRKRLGDEFWSKPVNFERRLTLPTGETATLLCMTQEWAKDNPYLRRSGFFFHPSPRFGFARGEQRLLEFSMLDIPDDNVAASLHLSVDAIKKRWRSIHAKVDSTDPGLLANANSGADRRRALLGYLRMHLEEIRPYFP